jgi:uncharacterized membrane protein
MLTLRSTDTAATTKTEDPDKARKALEGYRLLAGFVFTISLLTLIVCTLDLSSSVIPRPWSK